MANVIRRWLAPVRNSRVSHFMLFSAIFHIGLFGITDVILNFYFTSLGHSAETIGMLQSLPRIGGLVVSLPVGIIATRFGPYRIILYSTVGIAAALILPLALPALPALAVSRFLIGLFYGGQQIATNPFMGNLVTSDQQPFLFSYHNVITMLATAFGSFVGGFLPMLAVSLLGLPPAQDSAHSTAAYAAALLTGMIVVLFCLPPLFKVSDSSVAIAATHTSQKLRSFPWLRLLLMATPMLFFGFTGGLTFPFYNLFFRETFAVSDAVVGTILGIGWIGMGIVPLVNPYLDRRFGRAAALFITLTTAAVAFFALSFAPTLPLSVVAFVIACSARNTMQPLFQPLVMANLPAHIHNMASSVGFVVWNMGWFFATSLSGFLKAAQGFDFIMQVVAVGVLLTGVSVMLVFRQPALTTSSIQEVPI